MSPWTSIPRRLLLRLAGAGLALSPARALSQAVAATAPPSPVSPFDGGRAARRRGRPPLAAIWSQYFAVQRIWAYCDRP